MQQLEQGTGREGRLRKWFHKDNLIVLVLAGILLFVIALPTESKAEGTKTAQPENSFLAEKSSEEGNTAANNAGMSKQKSSLDEYKSEQELRLKELLEAMEGVGSVEVMLTFVSSEELVVEKDKPTVRSNTVEKDSQGGNRTISQFESEDTTVYNSVDGDSTPYVIKTLNPRVEGALIVAQGAKDSGVSRNITEAVCALFGVEAHRVKVVDMEHKSGTSGTVTGLSGN